MYVNARSLDHTHGPSRSNGASGHVNKHRAFAPYCSHDVSRQISIPRAQIRQLGPVDAPLDYSKVNIKVRSTHHDGR